MLPPPRLPAVTSAAAGSPTDRACAQRGRKAPVRHRTAMRRARTLGLSARIRLAAQGPSIALWTGSRPIRTPRSSALHEPPIGGVSNPLIRRPGPAPKLRPRVQTAREILLVYQNAGGVWEAVAVTHCSLLRAPDHPPPEDRPLGGFNCVCSTPPPPQASTKL